MSYVTVVQTARSEDTRARILAAAKILLRRFGEDKMTVVDIARSLHMSHANVYRFFKTKSDILDAIIDDWLSRVETVVEEIVHRPVSAAERLEAVVLELHRKRRQKYLEDAEVFETYRRVVELRPEVVAQRREKILNVFQRLVIEGIQTGEFKPVGAREAAIAFQDATAVFLNALLIPNALNEETEARAKNVVRFLIAGFSAAPAAQTKPFSAHRPRR